MNKHWTFVLGLAVCGIVVVAGCTKKATPPAAPSATPSNTQQHEEPAAEAPVEAAYPTSSAGIDDSRTPGRAAGGGASS